MFGRLGVVSYDAEGRLQCHICGRFCVHVGSHLKVHRVTPCEYRASFELNHLQPLASREYCLSRRPIALKNQLEGKFPSGDVGRAYLEVERLKGSNQYVRRLQERLTRSEMMQVNNPSFLGEVRRKISISQRRSWLRRRATGKESQ